MMGLMAAVISLQDNLPLIARHRAIWEKNDGQRPTPANLAGLEFPGFRVHDKGDLMADYTELLYNGIQAPSQAGARGLSYFYLNPQYDPQARVELLELHGAIANCIGNWPEVAQYKGLDIQEEVDYRLLQSYPDKLIQVTRISTSIQGQVTDTQANRFFSETTCAIATETAFNFALYGKIDRSCEPTEALFFLYFRSRVTANGTGHLVSRLDRLDKNTVDRYNAAEWDGKYFEEFPTDMKAEDPLRRDY